jgi:hypothetical protein
VSIEVSKRELSALNADDQRKMTAFLVSLQDSRDDSYRKKLAEKIDKPASGFARLICAALRFLFHVLFTQQFSHVQGDIRVRRGRGLFARQFSFRSR